MANTFELYRFAGTWGLPSASPFCIKLETWCRIAGLDYEPVDLDGPPKSKTGKLPYIVDDGELIDDSQQIIEHLKATRGVDPDSELTDRERADGHALRRMIEDSLYWALLHERWIVKANWEVTRQAYFGHLPPVIRQVVPAVVRRGVIKSQHSQGFGRRSQEMRDQMARHDIEAMAAIIGDGDYVASTVSTVDATASAMIWNILASPYDSKLKTVVQSKPELVAYHTRMHEAYWG